MNICAACDQYYVGKAAVCPHCGVHRQANHGVRVSAIAALMGLAVACNGDATSSDPPADQPEYGVAIIDNDGDGYNNVDDCDDNDAAINPGAEEIDDDGIDSDCDGEDNNAG